MKSNYLIRIRIISVFIFLFSIVLIGRLYFIQVVHNDTYIDKAERQYASTARNIFTRGSIYFTNKDGTLVSAATLKTGSTITVNPQILTNPEEVYKKVNEIIKIDYEDFMAKTTKKGDPYEEILVRQDLEIGEKVDALKVPGLKSIRDRWRFYPGGEISSHVIGILGFKGDEYAGRYGLERQFEKELVREDGSYTNFFAQIFEGIKKATGDSGQEADIVTTIEPVVQTYLENILASTTEKWNSDLTGGIIMDPSTGEIYAMEVYPTFNPNYPEQEASSKIFSNPLVENVYEMGSIIKPITVAAGIDAGVISPQWTYYDGGSITVSNKVLSNFDGKARGVVGVQDLLSQSLNVGAVQVQKLLGNKRFAEYLFNFGIDERTGIELPNEAKNLVDNIKTNVDVNFATASFGQGIALTPLSTIRALAVLANGGVLVQPHLIKSVNYKIGYSKETKTEEPRRVVSKETTDKLAKLLTYSYANVLPPGSLKIPNYSVAVKTGTAQVAKASGGGYEENKVLHSFVGYFPAYNPKFIIFRWTVDPKGARFSSETLTSSFSQVVSFLINYYEVPPDR